ncbi:MAG TPA: hypothetical protein VLG11_02355 [Candidatus Saccharimonadales bacterium]|nr:hypothetical protein [Candidatus Saccharimonadales bacterium]
MTSVEGVYQYCALGFNEAAEALQTLGEAQRSLVNMHDAYAGVSKETGQADMQTATARAREAVEAASAAIQFTFGGLQECNAFGRNLVGYAFNDNISPPRQRALGILRLPVGEDPEADRAEVDDLREKLDSKNPAENDGGRKSIPGYLDFGGWVDAVRVGEDEIAKIPHVRGSDDPSEEWGHARENMNERMDAIEITQGQPGFEQMTRYVPPNGEEDAGAVYTTYDGETMDSVIDSEGGLKRLDSLTPEQCDTLINACEFAANNNLYIEPGAKSVAFDAQKGLTIIDTGVAGRSRAPEETAADCVNHGVINGPYDSQLPAAATTLYNSYKKKFGEEAARRNILAVWQQRNYKYPPGFKP